MKTDERRRSGSRFRIDNYKDNRTGDADMKSGRNIVVGKQSKVAIETDDRDDRGE
jgi:hypothetical protein